MLLKVGRHLRPQPHYKLIISREEGENRFLEGYRYQFTSITTVSCPGPLALVDGNFESEAELQQAAAIVARYSKGRSLDEVTLEVRSPDGSSSKHTPAPRSPQVSRSDRQTPGCSSSLASRNSPLTCSSLSP